jgi:hypothetical protein
MLEFEDKLVRAEGWCYLKGLNGDRILVKLPVPVSPVPEHGDTLVVSGTVDQKHEPDAGDIDFHPYLMIKHTQLPKLQKRTGELPTEWKVYRAADIFPRLVEEASRKALLNEFKGPTEHHVETLTNGIKHREFAIPNRRFIIIEGVPTVIVPNTGGAWIDDATTNTRVSLGISKRLHPNAFSVGKPARAVGYPDVGISGNIQGLHIRNATPLP